ncbi:hypothetical protein MMC17_001915 [Xylographa soralifera]|nr:hypothetical protein [Xylographa soralifera]
MAEQDVSLAMEAPQESTLLDSAIPAEQTKYVPDVQEPELAHPEPEHSLAHINPFWRSNPSAPTRLPEQQITSEPDNPLEQTITFEENHLSGPLAAFEQPTFPEIVESLEHAPSEAQAKPEEPLASVAKADLSESPDISAQHRDFAQLIGMDEPSSSHSEVLSQSNNELATATLTREAIPSEHVNTTKEQSSAEAPHPMDTMDTVMDTLNVEPTGPSDHTQPFQIPTTSGVVHHGDHMDRSEESQYPAQAGMWEQTDSGDDQEVIGRTLDVDSSDTDSALGSDTSSLTTSISSSVTDYRFEHGRRYHAFHDGAYYLPNDEIETDRLDLQHHVWRLTLNGALYLSPISDNIASVLDVGTGTGIWAIEFAQEHPSTQVVGVDLSPIQPTFVPPNCSFIIDNVEEDWVYDKKFDFIHARMLVLGMHDWPRFFRQSWDYMKPGAWLEMQELQFPVRSDDGSAEKDSPFYEWSLRVMEAAEKVSINPTACEKFEEQLAQQGFVNIRYETIKWPIGSWAKGKKEKEIGRWMLENTMQGLQGVSMALLTRHLGWSREAVELFLVGVRKQLLDRSSHCYVDVRVVLGQKPFAA